MALKTPKPMSTNVAAIVALIGAVAGLIAVMNRGPLGKLIADLWTQPVVARQEAQKKFDDAYNVVLALIKATPPPRANMVRESVGVAYDYAKGDDSLKCKVVNIIINYGDQTVAVQFVPVEFARDVDQGTTPRYCAGDVHKLAILYKSKGAYVSSRASNLNDQRTTALNVATEKVIADDTTAGTKGWMYIGRSDGHGNLSDPATRMIKESRAEGRITTTRALTLYAVVPVASEDQVNPVGRVRTGSVLDVLDVKDVAEVVQEGSPPAAYTWARVKIVSQGATSTSMRTPTRRVLVRSPAIVTASAHRCAPFPETNSRHGASQRWVYVGQKVYGDDAFVRGTSLLDTPCVPRDGMAARVLQQTRVFVGIAPKGASSSIAVQCVVAR